MARYFNAIEAMCKDGTYVPPEYLGNFERVASQADELRAEHGGPIFVVSGYRTESYNKGRGVEGSQHLTASALDLRPRTVARWSMMTVEERVRRVHEFYKLAVKLIREDRMPLVGGLGYYPGKFVHIDVRPRKAGGTLFVFAKAYHGHLDGTVDV